MFRKTARYYDAIYASQGKDYRGEVEKLAEFLGDKQGTSGKALLDVCCGTGAHIACLRDRFDEIVGVDLDPAMLKIARARNEGVKFIQGDMAKFDAARTFDVVTCLFSSINYAENESKLQAAVANLARHVSPDGLLVVEPWFAPDTWYEGRLYALFVDEPELKIARMNVSQTRGTTSIIDFHYLIGTPEGVEHLTEHLELGLYTHAQYTSAFERAGLEVRHDTDGLAGRGLYVGRRPSR